MAEGGNLASAEPSATTSGQQAAAVPESGGVDEDGYAVGTRVSCTATFDNEAHPAEIVEKKMDEGGCVLYYVHFLDCDKRLDEWVSDDRIKEQQLKHVKSAEVGSPRFASANSAGELLLQQVNGDTKPYTTRTMKRRFEEIHHVTPGVDELPPIDAHFEKQHQQRTKMKNIQSIELGRHEVDTWYYSPYPEPYASQPKLYVCEYDLKYFRKKRTLARHLARLERRGPPGDEVYTSPEPGVPGAVPGAAVSPGISLFEVDGLQHKLYCQNLCLLAKLFLDHKTLYYDVDLFLFYVLCERDAEGYHVVGYFSKEKCSADNYNVACILTLPCHQRKGYGRFLIALSYELSRREGKLGTPERPLSDLGAVSYRTYWTHAVFDVLKDHKNLSIKDISEKTGLRPDDIISALSPLGLIKYYRGDHLLAVTPKLVDEHLARMPPRRGVEMDPACLRWTPPAAPLPPALLKSQSLKNASSLKR